MKRIRDYYLSRVLEEVTKKKVEFILDEDLEKIESLVIKNTETSKLEKFKDITDFEFLKKVSDGLYVEIEGFDLTDMKLEFQNAVTSIVLRNCRIDNLEIVVNKEYNGFKLVLDKVRSETGIRVNEQFAKCNELKVIGKATTELTREYTVQEITDSMKEKVEGYLNLPEDKQASLLQKYGYLSVYPQRIDITGIDKLKSLKAISLKYLEIDTINFSEITKYSKDIRALDVIEFIDCTFNEAPVLYKQPVKRLVINHCNVKRKSLLPNFVKVNAIEVIDTKGMELPKLNEPKILKGLKFISSEVDLTNIKNVKEIETLIILDQKLPNIDFAKKLKKLKYLVVSKDFVQDTSVLKKLKKLQFIEIEQDDLAASYNELFV